MSESAPTPPPPDSTPHNYFNDEERSGDWEVTVTNDIQAELVRDSYPYVEYDPSLPNAEHDAAVATIRSKAFSNDKYHHQASIAANNAVSEDHGFNFVPDRISRVELPGSSFNETLREALQVNEPRHAEELADRDSPELTKEQIESFKELAAEIDAAAAWRARLRDADASHVNKKHLLLSGTSRQEADYWEGTEVRTIYNAKGEMKQINAKPGMKEILTGKLADMFDQNPRFQQLYIDRMNSRRMNSDEVHNVSGAQDNLSEKARMAREIADSLNDSEVARKASGYAKEDKRKPWEVPDNEFHFDGDSKQYTSWWNRLPEKLKLGKGPDSRTFKTGMKPIIDVNPSGRKTDRRNEDLAYHLRGNGRRHPYGAPLAQDRYGNDDLANSPYTKTVAEEGSRQWYLELPYFQTVSSFHEAQARTDLQDAERNLMKTTMPSIVYRELFLSADDEASKRASTLPGFGTPAEHKLAIAQSVEQSEAELYSEGYPYPESEHKMFLSLNQMSSYLESLDGAIRKESAITGREPKYGHIQRMQDLRSNMVSAYNIGRFQREDIHLMTTDNPAYDAMYGYYGLHSSERLADGGIRVDPSDNVYYPDGSVVDSVHHPAVRRWPNGALFTP